MAERDTATRGVRAYDAGMLARGATLAEASLAVRPKAAVAVPKASSLAESDAFFEPADELVARRAENRAHCEKEHRRLWMACREFSAKAEAIGLRRNAGYREPSPVGWDELEYHYRTRDGMLVYRGEHARAWLQSRWIDADFLMDLMAGKAHPLARPCTIGHWNDPRREMLGVTAEVDGLISGLADLLRGEAYSRRR